MFFFFKQKTAYEMRISDWSSDECSSDLVSIFMDLMCLPLEHFDEFRELVVSYFSAVTDMAERARHADTINSHLVAIVEERRKEPKDDLISKLLHADVDGRPLTYAELMSISFNMFVGGLDTVVNGMSFG